MFSCQSFLKYLYIVDLHCTDENGEYFSLRRKVTVDQINSNSSFVDEVVEYCVNEAVGGDWDVVTDFNVFEICFNTMDGEFYVEEYIMGEEEEEEDCCCECERCEKDVVLSEKQMELAEMFDTDGFDFCSFNWL